MSKVSMFKILHGMSYTGIPTMIFGECGLGKSSMIRYLGQIKNVPCFVKSANKLTDIEVMGIPYTVDVKSTDENGVEFYTKDVKYSLPKYIKELQKNPNGILFFDEITTAPESIQTMLLTIIQDCEFNEFKIPETTFRVAAGNYSNIVGTKQMSMALMNRFANFHMEFDVDEFCDGIQSGWTNYELAVINEDKEEILKKQMKYIAYLVKFLKSHRDYGHKMPEEVIDKTDVSFPTPRSWDNVIKALSILDGNDDDYQKEIIKALVGPDAGNLFWNFMKTEKVFELDLTQFYGKESEFKIPHPDKHDEVHYIMKSIMYLMKNDTKKSLELWKTITNHLHNKDNKYGSYIGFDNFIMKYINAAVQLIMNSCTDIQEKSKTVIALNKEIDDWNDLHSSSLITR